MALAIVAHDYYSVIQVNCTHLSVLTVLSFYVTECNAAIHKKCIDKIIGRCTGTAANSRDTMVS